MLSIQRKALVAVSGLVLYGYVVVHMLGNLEAFGGASAFDAYHDFLRRIGEPVLRRGWFLWLVRPVLAAALVVHVVLVVRLSRATRAARATRPSSARRRWTGASYATRSMRLGGVLLLAFVFLHVLHLTLGAIQPVPFDASRPYQNLAAGFGVWWVAPAYLLAVAALGLHLHHGVWSAAQTLGLTVGRDRLVRNVSRASALAISAGFAAVPVAGALGMLP